MSLSQFSSFIHPGIHLLSIAVFIHPESDIRGYVGWMVGLLDGQSIGPSIQWSIDPLVGQSVHAEERQDWCISIVLSSLPLLLRCGFVMLLLFFSFLLLLLLLLILNIWYILTMDGRTDWQKINGWIEGQKQGQIDGWTEGWMEGQKDRQTEIAFSRDSGQLLLLTLLLLLLWWWWCWCCCQLHILLCFLHLCVTLPQNIIWCCSSSMLFLLLLLLPLFVWFCFRCWLMLFLTVS